MNSRLLAEASIESLDAYVASGGGSGLAAAQQQSAQRTVEELTRAGLRGRGGAGFTTGVKWSSVLAGPGRQRYAVCNAAEGEPATFKDRTLLRLNPYLVLEGLLIAARTVDAVEAYIAIKASFVRERERLEGALAEMTAAGWVDRPVHLIAGPEEYLFGEEKAMLEVIEGNEPLPRWLPPYLHGLFVTSPQLGWTAHEGEPPLEGPEDPHPTLVNNVETLANVAQILANGADWFRKVGTEASPGSVLSTVIGDVSRPGVFEIELGTPLRELLEQCGAFDGGHSVKAVLSGVSNPVLTATQLDTALSYEAFEAVGSGLGAAGFVVYDDRTCMVEVTAMLSKFLHVESCGQCPPCKLGTRAITTSLDRIISGEGGDDELGVISRWLRTVTDGSRCYLPVEEQRLVSSMLRAFPEDFAAHLEHGRCPTQRTLPIPKIVDIRDGMVVYDERQARKRPDWTYAD